MCQDELDGFHQLSNQQKLKAFGKCWLVIANWDFNHWVSNQTTSSVSYFFSSILSLDARFLIETLMRISGPKKEKKKEKKNEKIDVATMYDVSKWLSSPLFRCELSSIRISVCGCPLPPVDYILDVDYDDICRHGASPQWHFYLSSSSNGKRWCVNTRVSTMNVGCPIDTHVSTICFTRPPWKYLREIRVRGKVQWAIDIRSCRAQWKPFQSSVLERLITTMNNSTEVLLASARV